MTPFVVIVCAVWAAMVCVGVYAICADWRDRRRWRP